MELIKAFRERKSAFQELKETEQLRHEVIIDLSHAVDDFIKVTDKAALTIDAVNEKLKKTLGH